MKRDRHQPRLLRGLMEARYSLLPLHAPTARDDRGRVRGKSPRDKDWTRRDYSSFDPVAHMAEGCNVGVRLRETDLVVDVDPRNFEDGDDPLARLAADTGLDQEACPRVRTGSGGLHLYLKLPPGIRLRDSLGEYPGIEFKSVGRQVVAPGSVHPDTGRAYYWETTSPPAGEAPNAPDRLIRLARRPAYLPTAGGGEHTQEEVAEMLDALDPHDFREHDKWLRLMMACHHASGGDARDEFVEWSSRDELYSGDKLSVGRRWDSLGVGEDAPRVTYRTLHAVLREHGRADAIPRTPAADDFEDVDPDVARDAGVGPERLGPLERMNEKYWAVLAGGKFRVMFKSTDPTTDPPRGVWTSVGLWDFRQYLSNQYVTVRGRDGEAKRHPIVDAWMGWSRRRTANGVLFDPERDHPGFLNLWTGWAVEPKRGDWGILRDLLWEVLCDRDDAMFEYVMNWAAHLVQRPGEVAETALCFQGRKGTGKGTFARALVALAGRHGLHVGGPDHLSGRFNHHLRDLLMLFADEALRPGDRAAESRLKVLLTEPTLAYEAKGRDVESGRNFVRVILATNEDWFVPVGLADDERRFVVQRVSDAWVGRTRRFEELHAQLRAGGLAALLWDLTSRELGGWHPREDRPSTSAAVEQRARNLNPVGSWWLEALLEGTVPGADELDWEAGEVSVFKHDLRAHFVEWCRGVGVRAGASNRGVETMFAKELARVCPEVLTCKRRVPDDRFDLPRHSDGRMWAYSLPALGRCRVLMEGLLGGDPGWPRD